MRVHYIAYDGTAFATEEDCLGYEAAREQREEDRREGRLEAYWGCVCDLASDLLYYDRKEDERLTREDVKELIASGAITLNGTVGVFRAALVDSGLFVEPTTPSSATREEPEPALGFGE